MFILDTTLKSPPTGALIFLEKAYRFQARDYKGDREGIPHIHPIPQVIRLELFLTPQISRGIRQQPIT